MATAAEKLAYDEKSHPIREKIKEFEKDIEKFKVELRAIPAENKVDICKKKLEIIDLLTGVISMNIAVSLISIEKLNLKNESFLNEARKSLYVILQYFEEMVGKIIDTGFEENIENLEILDQINDNLQRFAIFQKLGYLLNKVEFLFGDNSKWKWSFVELSGRLTTAMKNCINFKDLQRDLDPSVPGYPERMNLMNILVSSLTLAADRYRNKYELTNKRVDDMKCALSLLAFQKRLAIVQNDAELADLCSKKYDSWNKKLKEDFDEEDRKSKEALRGK